ncbi:MAG: hypothetical protein WBJ33_05320, partial [Candidatus Nanopelagicales bacterium]
MSNQGSEYQELPVESYTSGESKSKVLNKNKIRRARIIGVILLILAGVVMFILAPAAEGNATFGLSFPDDRFQLDALSVPSTG